MGLVGVGTDTAECQISTLRAGKRKPWLAHWGDSEHQIPVPLITTCSADPRLLGVQALNLPGPSRWAENL